MAKRPFIRKQKKKQHGVTFWDNEYKNASHLKLSTEASADLLKFTRWLQRQKDAPPLTKNASVLDVGCGNGRNIIYLANTFHIIGTGYDISNSAITSAIHASQDLPISYKTRSMAGPLDLENDSQLLVLDMMSSHFLSSKEREFLRDEIYRILSPGGFLFMKTFLADDDLHTRRLLRDHPGKEPNSYIHPVIGVAEYVYDEETLLSFLSKRFSIKKVYRSHKHKLHGKARKRRTISIYAQKDFF
jgi:SAM-dependent methyltransferase